MKVENKIHIYSIDGKDTTVGEKIELVISNVWNTDKLVQLQIGDGKKIEVLSFDLIKAISNSTDNAN